MKRWRGGVAASIGEFVRDARGAAAVEFAIVLPVLALSVIGAMEVARLIWAQNVLRVAVREAARCSVVQPSICGSASQIGAYAVQRAAPYTVPAAAFTFSQPACGNQVAANYTFVSVSSYFFAPITLRAQFCYPD